MKRRVHEGFDSGTLQKALRADDPLVVVLRAHLYMEQLLHVFLKRTILGAAFESDDYEDARLRFVQLVPLLVAAGVLSADDAKPLLAFNALRNHLAHGYGAEITDQSQRRLFETLSPKLRREMFEDGDAPPTPKNFGLLRETAHGLVLMLTHRMTNYMRKKKHPFGYLRSAKK